MKFDREELRELYEKRFPFWKNMSDTDKDTF